MTDVTPPGMVELGTGGVDVLRRGVLVDCSEIGVIDGLDGDDVDDRIPPPAGNTDGVLREIPPPPGMPPAPAFTSKPSNVRQAIRKPAPL